MAARKQAVFVVTNPDERSAFNPSLAHHHPHTHTDAESSSAAGIGEKKRRAKRLKHQLSTAGLAGTSAAAAGGSGTQRHRSAGHAGSSTPGSSASATTTTTGSVSTPATTASGHTPPGASPISPHVYGSTPSSSFERERDYRLSPTTEQPDPFAAYHHPPPAHPSYHPASYHAHHRSGSSSSVVEISPVQGMNGQGGSYRREEPTERVQIMATTDGDDYVPVDITGLQGATRIRERICEMLRLPSQPPPALYRIEFGMPPAKERGEITDGNLIEQCHRSGGNPSKDTKSQLRYFVEPKRPGPSTTSPESMLSPASVTNGVGGKHGRSSPSYSSSSPAPQAAPHLGLAYTHSYTPNTDHGRQREMQYAQQMQQQQQQQQQQQHSPQGTHSQLHPPAIPPRDPSRERPRPKPSSSSSSSSTPAPPPIPVRSPSSTPLLPPDSAPTGSTLGFDLGIPMLGSVGGHHERSFSDGAGMVGGGTRGYGMLAVGGGNGIPVIPVQYQQQVGKADWGDVYCAPDGGERPQVPEKKRTGVGGGLGVQELERREREEREREQREREREREQRERESRQPRSRLQTNNLPPTTTSRPSTRLHSPTTGPSLSSGTPTPRNPSLNASKSYSNLRNPLPYGPSRPVRDQSATPVHNSHSRAWSPVPPAKPPRYAYPPPPAPYGAGAGASPVSPQQTRRPNGAFANSVNGSEPGSATYSDHSLTPTSALPTPPHTNIPSYTGRQHEHSPSPLPPPPPPPAAAQLPSPPATNLPPFRPRYVPFNEPQASSDTTNLNQLRSSPASPPLPVTPGGASLRREAAISRPPHHGGPRPPVYHGLQGVRRDSEAYAGLAPASASAGSRGSGTPTPTTSAEEGSSPTSPSPRSSQGGPPTPEDRERDRGDEGGGAESEAERVKRGKRKAREFAAGVTLPRDLEMKIRDVADGEGGMLGALTPGGDVEGLMETVMQSVNQILGGAGMDEQDGATRTVVPPRHRPASSLASKPPSPQPPTLPLHVPARTTPVLPVPPVPYDDENDDDDDDDDDEGETLWRKPPAPRANTPSASGALTPASAAVTGGKPKVPPIQTNPSVTGAPPRASPRTETWGQLRPAPEEILENLDHFFPGHDLDAPLLDATSADGSSPTDRTEVIVPVKTKEEKQKQRRTKSIRDKAMEKGKRMQLEKMEGWREEDGPGGGAGGEGKVLVKRKRTTKIWNHKIEELKPGADLPPVPEVPALPGSSEDPDEETMTFSKGALIGKGTYGRVYLAILVKTGEICAVKQVELPKTEIDKQDSKQLVVVEAIKSEREVLQDLDHPNIVQYMGYSQSHDVDTDQDFFNIFLEYVPGGSVGNTLRRYGKFTEDIIKNITGQILEGLAYLHEMGIVHRDLKADNILIDQSWTCKISDFGTSKRSDDPYRNQEATLMQGSIPWMAPEVLLKQGDGYGAKADIWSLGCVFLEMWAGVRPWSDQDILPIMFKVAQERQAPPVPEGVHLSVEAEAFRLRCCAINPDDRPTAAVLRQDPYLELPKDWKFPPFPGTTPAPQPQSQPSQLTLPTIPS